MTETHPVSGSATSPQRAFYPGLTGRVAVVTGGSRGIGAATAAALAANGAAVAVVGRDQAAIDHTVEAINATGELITMSSAAARQAARSSAAYAAAKAGVVAFTRHLANEVAADGIRFNCLAPSAVENDKMRAWTTPEKRAALAATFPLGRIGQPEDVAAAALWLASSEASWITGVTLDIAGGKTMV